MGRKIVFINQATGYLTIDIINEFARHFEKVALITGSIRVQETHLDVLVEIKKISRYVRGSNISKAISWIVGTIEVFYLLTTRYRRYEKFFFTIPPTAYLLTPLLKGPYSITVYDLFPEAFKVNGLNEKSLIYKWWADLNRRIYPKAFRIFTLSENMKRSILDYSPSSVVHIIPNWTAFTGYSPVKKEDNKIISREGLDGKFIIQYSGNIGVTHNVETLVEVAEILKYEDMIEFLIIGRGDRTNSIREYILEKKLSNCHLIPFRKDEELYESLCAASIAVIILGESTEDISVPSKLYNVFAAGVPVLAIAKSGSELSRTIEAHGAGRSFEKDNLTGIVDFIKELKYNELLYRSMSDNSIKASDNYTSRNASHYLDHYLYGLN